MPDRIRSFPNMNSDYCGKYATDCIFLLEEQDHQSERTWLHFNRDVLRKVNRVRESYRQPEPLCWQPINKQGIGGRTRIVEDGGYGMVLLYLLLEFPDMEWDLSAIQHTEIGTGVDVYFGYQIRLTTQDEFDFFPIQNAILIESKGSFSNANLMDRVREGEDQIRKAWERVPDWRTNNPEMRYVVIASEFETPSVNVLEVN